MYMVVEQRWEYTRPAIDRYFHSKERAIAAKNEWNKNWGQKHGIKATVVKVNICMKDVRW